jgi:hypothetical protein
MPGTSLRCPPGLRLRIHCLHFLVQYRDYLNSSSRSSPDLDLLLLPWVFH